MSEATDMALRFYDLIESLEEVAMGCSGQQLAALNSAIAQTRLAKDLVVQALSQPQS